MSGGIVMRMIRGLLGRGEEARPADPAPDPEPSPEEPLEEPPVEGDKDDEEPWLL